MMITTAIDYKQYWNKSISFEDYLNNFEKELKDEKGAFAQYLPQNWSRQSRILRKLFLEESIAQKLKAGDSKEFWLVITEHWCGDASQIIPVIQKMADMSEGRIETRYFYRDQDTDLIDAHLTNGKSRSIPIVIQLNEKYELMNTFGPRPKEAQELVMELLANKEAYSVPLHSWYARDKQKSTIKEVLEALYPSKNRMS